jgi:catechol 2,3-dioxygenase-like lactoylglutathione lyase family enzyme
MEVTMSSTQPSHERPTSSAIVVAMDSKLEVVVLPVADVDRSKRFYTSLGWRLDADFSHGSDWRVVQLTPPGSPCSIMFGKGLTAALPGSVQGTFLVVDDIEEARAALIARDVAASDVFHFEGNRLRVDATSERLPGPHPERQSYFSFVSFSDPDGNGWLIQEVKTRLPGRGLGELDPSTLAELLREAEAGHTQYTATASKHHWSDWYAAYIVARQRGQTPAAAAQSGAEHIERAQLGAR